MSALPFDQPRGHAAPGDPLGRVYTPTAVAEAVVESLDISEPFYVTEPSVGGGAFIRAVHRRWGRELMTTTGFDIDPNAPGLKLVDDRRVGDWRDAELGHHGLPPADLVIGNPPFGAAAGGQPALIGHVLHCLSHGLHVALILPLATLGLSTFQRKVLATNPLYRLSPIIPRPWDRVREVALFEWSSVHLARNGQLASILWK